MRSEGCGRGVGRERRGGQARPHVPGCGLFQQSLQRASVARDREGEHSVRDFPPRSDRGRRCCRIGDFAVGGTCLDAGADREIGEYRRPSDEVASIVGLPL